MFEIRKKMEIQTQVQIGVVLMVTLWLLALVDSFMSFGWCWQLETGPVWSLRKEGLV